MNLNFSPHLVQAGTRIEGNGEEFEENAKRIAGPERRPISVSGAISRGNIDLTFTFFGARRVTHGNIRLREASGANALRGTFAWDAARMSGMAQAERYGGT